MKRIANLRQMDRADRTDREVLLDTVERRTELPLMILSSAMIPLLAGLLVWDAGPVSRTAALALYASFWAIFAAELAIRIAIAPQPATYLQRNWFDLVVVIFPIARPLRIPLVIWRGSRAYGRVVRFAHVDYLAGYAIGLVLLIATIVTSVEQGRDSPIESFADALWWSIATVTTVGYGDIVPVTAAGRALAYVLMIAGIGLFATLTANLAAMLARREDPGTATIAALEGEVRALRQALERLESLERSEQTNQGK